MNAVLKEVDLQGTGTFRLDDLVDVLSFANRQS
jgi:hypothetical protein